MRRNKMRKAEKHALIVRLANCGTCGHAWESKGRDQYSGWYWYKCRVCNRVIATPMRKATALRVKEAR